MHVPQVNPVMPEEAATILVGSPGRRSIDGINGENIIRRPAMLYGAAALPPSGGGPRRGGCVASKMVDRVRLAHIVIREAIFLVLSLAAAVVFLHHQILYLGGETLTPLPALAYGISTILAYGFIRVFVFVGGMRAPRGSGDPATCPECGRPLEDGTLLGAQSHRPSPPRAVRVVRPIPVGPSAQRSRSVTLSRGPIPGIGSVVNPAVEAQLLRELADAVRSWAADAIPASGTDQRSPPKLGEAP